MADVKKYTSAAELQNHWIENIAPNYFDLDNLNNYRVGIFGYVNEVMSNVTMDAHYSINIARREFYPVSAQNAQSIYKMGALQKIDSPMATPGSCRATLLLDRDEVIENSTYNNGIYTCVIDSSTRIYADNIPFRFLYPIVIISKVKNNVWNHTIHYDRSNENSLDNDTSTNYYITNKTINKDGKKYLLISVNLKQVERETLSELVTTDTLVQSASVIFQYEGNIANFEAYYIAEPDVSTPVHLKKVMKGGTIPSVPFCHYQLLGNNLLQLTFPKNSFFTPDINSEIRVDVYSSLGTKGNFESFNGSLTCTMESDNYPYNNNMTMMGIIDGGCTGGKDTPTLEEYTNYVKDSYATNNTYTSTNDLQIAFDSLSDNVNNKLKFRKKRADIMYRLYGAYMLLKDKDGNVVPTNTLTVNMKLDEFDSYNEITKRAIIKPGTIFEYDPASESAELYTARIAKDVTLSDNLSEYDVINPRLLYTNPFLIVTTLDPNIVGYYFNTVNETHRVEYSYINDSSIVQFIGSNLKVYRNAIDGENFYKFSINISPTSEIDPKTIVSIPSTEDEDYAIKAKMNGMIESIRYEDNCPICTVKYIDGSTETIVCGSYTKKNESGEFDYFAGYKLNFDVFDEFIEGDTLATKKLTDLGKIRACLNFDKILYNNNMYIPMVIEEYNEALNRYTLCGYISTDDEMSGSNVLIEHGIMYHTGDENDNVLLAYDKLTAEVSVFYMDDNANYSHKYSKYDYFKKHTMTNTYIDATNSDLALINQIDYIRSTLVYNEDPENDSFILTIKEIPLAKANWVKKTSNYNYLTDAIVSNYKKIRDIVNQLENEYKVDMKFYNTYGKSIFFKAGIRDEWSPLKHVNCYIKFGVHLSSLTTKTTFLTQFRNYVKEKIELINSTGTSQSIYIMNIIHDIISNFSEIGYVEYYGFDEYSYDVQKIEPVSTAEMSDEMLKNYIPEFINISTIVENGENVPQIEVTFLDTIEE